MNLAARQTKESASNTIDEYFSFFGLKDVRHELWLLTGGTLTRCGNAALTKSNLPACRRHRLWPCSVAEAMAQATGDRRAGRQAQPYFLFRACPAGRQVYNSVFEAVQVLHNKRRKKEYIGHG